jgi:hypothetical protein
MLLMLTLPLQTFASAAMLGCTFAHQAAMEPVAMVDDTMAHCHESEPAPVPAPASHDCQHCAACALGAVLPVPVVDMAVPPASTRFAPHPAAAIGGYVPDGPERPPRLSLA